jgi:hypothetical protein
VRLASTGGLRQRAFDADRDFDRCGGGHCGNAALEILATELPEAGEQECTAKGLEGTE